MNKIIKYIIATTLLFNISINITYALEKDNDKIEIIQTLAKSNDNDIKSTQFFHHTPIEGDDSDINCSELFGSKEDPGSIRSIVDDILQYPRIIVPILVIALGIIDLTKAVIAGKEEDMKKAQKTFVKRILIGVAFFFVPVIVDIIMSLADIVWEGLGYGC